MKTSINKYFILASLLLVFNSAFANDPPFIKFKTDEWVNEKMESLTLEEKIAQLMMITVYPSQNNASKANAIREIKSFKPGGILVMQGNPVKTADWINQFQQSSELPLLVAIDGEWGPSMRIDSTIAYPYTQAIGAIQDTSLIYQMGIDFGEQFKQLGIQMNFAPVADINTNSSNPVINFRSFGENKHNVAEKAWMVSKGMQDAGVIAVAKHFPGHGDTKTDSHHTLPLVSHDKNRIDAIESYPFRYLAEKGISGIMTGHLNVPALDNSGATSSLSEKVVTDYLKNEIGFNGFVVTDAINMKGVQTKRARAEVEALIAGNDMIEFVRDLELAIQSVKKSVESGSITEEEINAKCRTVLALKRFAGLNNYQATNLKGLTDSLNVPKYKVTRQKLIKASFTVLANKGVIPVEKLEEQKIASVSIGSSEVTTFQKMLDNYTYIEHYVLPENCTEQEWTKLRVKLEKYDLIIAGVHNMNRYQTQKYGTSEIERKAVEELVREKNTLVTFFGNAYALKYFSNIHHASGLVLAYQDNKTTKELAAQLLFGAFGANGKLPVTVDSRFTVGSGITIKGNNSFAYSIPEEVGINTKKLLRIDTIAIMGIEEAAYPGCQVLIAKDGKIVYHKCFGYLTYNKIRPVEKNQLYDWASITKVTGPLPAIMKLVDEKKINLDSPLSRYWPDFNGTNKEHLKLREVLAHQARLEPYIAYWTSAVNEKGELDRKIFRTEPSEHFNVRVSDKLYMNPANYSVMMDTLIRSELLPRNKYIYSGLSFYLYPRIIENLTGSDYEAFLKENFYRPLGAYTITYNPYKHYPLKRIVPTEIDDFFRQEALCGFVHDEGAAMMAGVSGNAGLFGTTNDLAKIFQMYLQKGYYGGRRYISEETVEEFTRIQYPENENRRGLGFDKPLIDNYENDLQDAYPAVSASTKSFGHSGFTGTFAWADPENNLLFVFMSNRVYPTRENQRLYQLNIRTEMHQAIYDSIMEN